MSATTETNQYDLRGLLDMQAELDAARERADAAQQQLADIDLRPVLMVEVESSIQRFDAMEREYETRLAAIDESARVEVDRILLEAGADHD
ncbi:MAG: hypothetical protein WCI22_04950 [Actinomycetota bacterium]